ncbi:MAG: glycerol-3-phosphate 1-O-acyltransferase PlsY [Pelagibacteraceae bacterium]|jgi:glycerol-3-phosphate acyltransferase PlsY|nr:glycerol-3-phosphate 1-O-acyltransferase PlsY [Pelagibacteraceae bacterium]MBT5213407.1 glycerol-3-phosphate 1-O-acyltransferase PlsY [Pelagibacteraceae bacterium]MBT6198862.1 glycerol-3-phosphate 1-O-acyltransferase PlsY [Pelagibacteraceae bacterium]MBT6353512.1 glycerol-3-phosphate 1-O-acyltransferase PlsY [Pelagibacteraceae bacterium]
MIPLSSNLLFIILFYFLGSIPFALIIPKIFGYGDIRNTGSGNVGATNVLRMGNKYMAFSVLLADILKGLLPFIILRVYLDEIDTLSRVFLCHFAILGHIFPIWLKFKGGKGVATYIGFLLGLSLYLGIAFLFLWLIIAYISKYSSLSSLLSSLIAPIYFIFMSPQKFTGFFLLYIFIIIALKHHENIKKLLNKSENKIKFSK